MNHATRHSLTAHTATVAMQPSTDTDMIQMIRRTARADPAMDSDTPAIISVGGGPWVIPS